MGTASNAGSRMSGDVFRARWPEHASLLRKRRLAAPREIHSKEQMLLPVSRVSRKDLNPLDRGSTHHLYEGFRLFFLAGFADACLHCSL
jgi:hypothetical protein